MKETFKGRLNLTEKASQALLFMVQELKEENPHIHINVSKLCSWIVENYVRDHFSKDAVKIVKDHFDTKRYMTDRLKAAKTEDEIKAIFKDAAAHLGGKCAMNTTRTKPWKQKAHENAPRNAESASDIHLTGGRPTC